MFAVYNCATVLETIQAFLWNCKKAPYYVPMAEAVSVMLRTLEFFGYDKVTFFTNITGKNVRNPVISSF